MKYELSHADCAALPPSYAGEKRYMKYRDADREQPYAKYLQATRPVQPHVLQAIQRGRSPREHGYPVDRAADRLGKSGYEPMETGWTLLTNGVLMVSVLTNMPGVTAAMWDWWFGWHSRESARYKLWFPDAHRFAALAEDRSADRTLTDKQRYVGNVSYVDEYIGTHMQRLAIRFVDPDKLGFTTPRGTTHVCARVSLSTHPVAIGWLVHQVRPTEDGAEMRSRFFLNDLELLALPSRALPGGFGGRFMRTSVGRRLAETVVGPIASALQPRTLGTDMILHCAAEMNHLAGFLPQLQAEFRDLP